MDISTLGSHFIQEGLKKLKIEQVSLVISVVALIIVAYSVSKSTKWSEDKEIIKKTIEDNRSEALDQASKILNTLTDIQNRNNQEYEQRKRESNIILENFKALKESTEKALSLTTSEITELRSQVGGFEQQFNQQNQTVASYQTEITNLHSKLEQVEQRSNQQNQTVASYQTEITNLHSKLEQVEQRFNQQNQIISRLNTINTQLVDKNQKLVTEIEKVNKENKRMKFAANTAVDNTPIDRSINLRKIEEYASKDQNSLREFFAVLNGKKPLTITPTEGNTSDERQ